MFDYFKGILVDKSFPYCTIEVNGVGYRLLTNLRTLESIGELNSEVKIYAKLIHKEDSMTLCGFKNRQDRVIFDILTSVSGIGVKVALALLAEFETNELINLIISQDHKTISRTKGIGAKMAQKIVLEIKDKLAKLDVVPFVVEKTSNTKVSTDTISQVATVLESLGYSKNEYQGAIETALTQLSKDDDEELLKEVLKILSVF
ncbi:MAG: Holliday junction branch migration protein RuvA [Candidatus Gastranaerophilales bacterium]|nr:Holliday junction branch migration protein RuvA [Candidatus Gastranaerophilales bacterium]